MSKVKLLNKGQRVIKVAGKDFLPQQVATFSAEQAEQLQRLFKGEVFSLEDAVADFSMPEEEAEKEESKDEPLEAELTKKEIMEKLKEAGIEFDPAQKKAELLDLLK